MTGTMMLETKPMLRIPRTRTLSAMTAMTPPMSHVGMP